MIQEPIVTALQKKLQALWSKPMFRKPVKVAGYVLVSYFIAQGASLFVEQQKEVLMGLSNFFLVLAATSLAELKASRK